MILKSITLAAMLPFFGAQLFAQTGGDPGVGTIGNFDAARHDSSYIHKNELDILYTYGTSAGGLRYNTPQINYRAFNGKGSFFEFRVPVNSSKETSTGLSNTNVGDILATYNSSLRISNARIKYSFGLRVSTSNANKGEGITSNSYPMYLQAGLGTTDLMVAASYDFCKFLNFGAGVQLPVVQYNKNVNAQYLGGVYSAQLDDFRREPDAMLKLTGHFGSRKFKVNAGVIAIFHLSDDYYNTTSSANSKYYLVNSNGTNLNAQIALSYVVNKKFSIGLMYAKSLLTTDINADGLERSMVISPKITYAF